MTAVPNMESVEMIQPDWWTFEALRALKARYFRCLDSRDWSGLKAVFAENAVFDMRDETGALRAAGYDLPDDAGLVSGSDAIVESMARGLKGVISVHQGHMPEFKMISKDEAVGTWSMEDILRMPATSPIAEIRGYGRYHERYSHSENEWRIVHLNFTRTLRYVEARDGYVSIYAALDNGSDAV